MGSQVVGREVSLRAGGKDHSLSLTHERLVFEDAINYEISVLGFKAVRYNTENFALIVFYIHKCLRSLGDFFSMLKSPILLR